MSTPLPLAALCLAASTAAQGDALAPALARFLAAPTPEERARVAEEIAAGGAAFEDVLAGLRRGRSYSAEVPRGLILRERSGVGGLRHPYAIVVPEDYTPERRWPVRFELHGGMGAPEWEELDGAWTYGRTRSHEWIVVMPAGWWDSMWWEWSQVENFEAILRELRATWNLDEDRVVLTGGSDGGAAVFFYAMRAPDRFAGYAGFVAPPDRLARAELRPDGQMHLSNLAGQRFHLGFGALDEKVPIRHLERYMELFERSGVLLDWYAVPDAGHGLLLSDEQERAFVRFLRRTKRDPLPERLSWATERTDRYARRAWLAIEALEPADGEDAVDESNVLPRWGTSIQLRGPTQERVPWGRVELERDGNRIVARTRRVRRFRLLLSPDELDLARPVVVEVDGRVAHDAVVEPSVATLLRWAAIDDERTRLFAAELVIEP